MMDSTKYKDLKVQRGHNYHYYYNPADEGKPTLFFIHGFPSSSFDWSRQVAYFEPKGYGILVPDCLGYGGTSKPIELQEYRRTLLAQDFIDILDAEGLVNNVVGIGHGWGSMLLSSFVYHHQTRLSAFVFVALAHSPPITNVVADLQRAMKGLNGIVGSNVLGYWDFIKRSDAHIICDRNLDSFLQLWYPPTPETWLEWLCLPGKLQEWIKSNRQVGRPSWLTEQEYSHMRETLATNGLQAPMNYYKLGIANVNLSDNQAIPKEAYHITKPTLFVASLRNPICSALLGKMRIKKYAARHAKIVEINAGHWLQFEATEQLNGEMEGWLMGLNCRQPGF